MTGRARNWTWTLNHPTRQEMISLSLLSSSDGINYLIFGVERGSQGTLHFQGYLQHSNQIRMSAAKAILGHRVHLEVSKGTPEQNIRYCAKDGHVVVIYGTPKGQAKRRAQELSKFEEQSNVMKTLIDSGSVLKDLWDKDFAYMVKHWRGVERYIHVHKPERILPPKVECFIGKPGTGKTRFVHDFARIFYDGDLWTWGGDRWFDGYCGQKVACFDDFRGEIPISNLLKALDRYDNQQPVKGGFVWFHPRHIFITSNEKIESWYPDAPMESVNAIRRRLKIFAVNEQVY